MYFQISSNCDTLDTEIRWLLQKCQPAQQAFLEEVVLSCVTTGRARVPPLTKDCSYPSLCEPQKIRVIICNFAVLFQEIETSETKQENNPDTAPAEQLSMLTSLNPKYGIFQQLILFMFRISFHRNPSLVCSSSSILIQVLHVHMYMSTDILFHSWVSQQIFLIYKLS